MRLNPQHPALRLAVTIHPRTVKQPTETTLLKPASANKKLGSGSSVVSKGKWAGMPMYQLSLQERATCPSSCQQWVDCFGNNMAFAHRIDHTHPDFFDILRSEVNVLTRKYKHGVVIRPHVVGDYFSPEYAATWIELTADHPNLHIFGFTAHTPDSLIGRMIREWNKNPRVWVRFSNAGDNPDVLVANVADKGPGIPCPEQTGKTESCLTCGLCWSTTKPINFQEH